MPVGIAVTICGIIAIALRPTNTVSIVFNPNAAGLRVHGTASSTWVSTFNGPAYASEKGQGTLDVASQVAALRLQLHYPTCSFGSGTSHSGFTRFNPVELGSGAVEALDRG